MVVRCPLLVLHRYDDPGLNPQGQTRGVHIVYERARWPLELTQCLREFLQGRLIESGADRGNPPKTFWRVEADEDRAKGRRPTALTRQVSADDGTNPMTDRNLAPIARPTSRVICGAETFGDNTLDTKLGDRLEESHPMSRCGVWHDDGRLQAQVV